MKVVDPTEDLKRKKAPAKLKGGEDFKAEPKELKPTQSWLDAQMALLRLTIKQDRGYGNYLPQLDAIHQQVYDGTYLWDEESERYYQKQYVSFKISYRYYKGNKKRSYLFWPKHTEPSYVAKRIVDKNPGAVLKITTETGTAEYVYIGQLPSTPVDKWGYTRTGSHVMALWRSTGTMKARRKNQRHVDWESDARTSKFTGQ